MIDFIRAVLRVFDECDCHEDLIWRVKDEEVTFAAMCSDVFWWGTADAEDITPADVPLLESSAADLRAINRDEFTAELYCARKRGMRPQGAWYGPGMEPELVALFDACGPWRETDLMNPKPQISRT
jgi:hypothetical protein